MPSEFDPIGPYFKILLTAGEESFPSLGDVTNFLYDFNVLYEIARLATDSNYADFRFSHFVFYRKGRPLEMRDRLHIQSISLGSPLVIVAVIAAVPSAVGAIWGLVQIADKVTNAGLNRRKLKAEVEKLERENLQAETTAPSMLAEWLTAKRRIKVDSDDDLPQHQKPEVEKQHHAVPIDSAMETTEGFRSVLRIREAEIYYDQVTNRLERSSIRIRELDIEVIEPTRNTES
jgi:hypothetical protein